MIKCSPVLLLTSLITLLLLLLSPQLWHLIAHQPCPLPPSHPLDPLSISELRHAHSFVLHSSLLIFPHHINSSSPPNIHLHSAVLHEPHKQDVLSWTQGSDPLPPRKALLIVSLDATSYYLILNLQSDTVENVEEIHTVAATPTVLTAQDMDIAMALPLECTQFLEALKKRNLEKKEVGCLPHGAVGWYDVEEDVGKRLVKMQCYYMDGTENYYMRPIEGITMVVDLELKKVIKYAEFDDVPLPKSDFQKPPFLEPLNTISLERPRFTVDGHKVKWANWEFHVKPDYRAAAIISQASVRDPETGVMRSVLYKGFASELFVPFMDPTLEGQYFNTYVDSQENVLGLLCTTLQPLNDCPRNAHYMDGVFFDANGKPYIRPNMLCIFESYAGDVAWRHRESPISDQEMREARPKVTLIVRVIVSVANYDYILDWEFQTDGLIRIKVGMSGILMVKGTKYESIHKAFEANEELYGTMVAERTVGVIHDHSITFYLDLDVDGTDNTFVEKRMVKKEVLDSTSPRQSYWGVEDFVAKTEYDAKIEISNLRPANYIISNSKKKSKIGNPVSYEIVPGKSVGSLLALDDPPQVFAALVNNQIWVTPYNRSEEYAGSLHAYLSHGDDTLSRWTRSDRPIEDRDIVVWYTAGFHHIPSQEDFPVMPTVTESFELKPTNFYECNPIIKTHANCEDLPRYQFSA